MDYYVYTIFATVAILVPLYIFVLIKVCIGTKYTFILKLIVTFLISNISMVFVAIFLNFSAKMSEKKSDEIDQDKFALVCNLKSIFQAIHYLSFNLAIWSFSFRYWNIAHVMPLHLSGRQVSLCYKRSTIALFITGLLINTIAPCLYLGYSIDINNATKEGYDIVMTVYDQDKKGIIAGFYGVGAG